MALGAAGKCHASALPTLSSTRAFWAFFLRGTLGGAVHAREASVHRLVNNNGRDHYRQLQLQAFSLAHDMSR